MTMAMVLSLATETSSAPDSGEIVVQLFGVLVVCIAFFRIPFLLSQEFDEGEELVKQPCSFVLPSSVTWDKFKESEWQGFAAAYTAIQFRTHMQRFNLILNPKYGTGLFLLMFGVALMMYALSDPEPAKRVLVGYSVLVGIWMIVIEWGKSLKRSVARCKLT